MIITFKDGGLSVKENRENRMSDLIKVSLFLYSYTLMVSGKPRALDVNISGEGAQKGMVVAAARCVWCAPKKRFELGPKYWGLTVTQKDKRGLEWEVEAKEPRYQKVVEGLIRVLYEYEQEKFNHRKEQDAEHKIWWENFKLMEKEKKDGEA